LFIGTKKQGGNKVVCVGKMRGRNEDPVCV